jgi:hypothetical protein
VLSLSSQAFKLFSEGKSNVQVTIKLDIPPEHVTQLRLQYWRLQNQDDLESLYMSVKGKVSVLWKIYKELMIIWGMTIEEVASALNVSLPLHLARLYRELAKRGMSIEEIAAVVDIDLNKLPYMKQMLEETTKAVARKQLELDILETRISSLKEEENRRRNRIFTPSFLLSLC